ncbi:MAG: HesA/MoeB/ThiF family protein [Desulfatiglans sp.]|jgi:molybdopterin/thiamine biosynthesis adenylyltransferase|nr:HesA/MoeB/ThiF family protein [Desulfatiglans sp.]
MMNSQTQDRLGQAVCSRSERVEEPAGREVETLCEREALVIAEELGCHLGEVYKAALSKGIHPYRYLRNWESISLEEQLRLAESKVGVVGTGGLGGQTIMLLARIGIGHLVIADPDAFDETNLNRQAFSTCQALGSPKVGIVASVVQGINPAVVLTCHQKRIEPSNVRKMLEGCHLVVDALDNVPDRFLLEKAAKELGIPMIHGAIAGFEGRLMTIFPEDPGLRQLYGSEGADQKNRKGPELLLGTPGPTPALIASLQVMEVCKVILDRGNILRNRMLHVDLETGATNEFFF